MAKGKYYEEPNSMRDLRSRLPKVGDIIHTRMQCGEVSHGLGKPPKQDAVVTYVNEAHLWYELMFPCGIRQAYRVV